MAYRYDTGTISVANGSKTVTGTLTNFLSAVRRGDDLNAGGNAPVEIDGDATNDSVTDNTHFELVEPWPYTSLTDAPYSISKGPAWNDVTRLAVEVSEALANATEILSGVGVPSDSIGSDGSAYFRQDVAELYFKTSGAWGTAISLVGPAGAKGDKGDKGDTGAANSLAIGTVTTGSPGGSASATITGSAPSQTLNLTIPRGATGATGAQGDPGPANGLTIGTVTTGAAGSSADATITGTAPSQTLNLTIPKGDAGADGADGADGSLITATSTTSLTPAIDTLVFTVAAGLSFLTGMRVRGASASNPTTNWFSGIVATYSGTTLTITADDIGSSPVSAADWNIAVSGEKGVTGGVASVNGLLPSLGNVSIDAGDIPDTDTPTNYSPTSSDVQGHLQGIDTAIGAAGFPATPQGRLSLTSGSPITTGDVTAAATIYYTPAGGLAVPIYDGTATKMKVLSGELSLPLDSNSGHTGYHQSGKNFDLFVFNDGGTMRLGSGPTWNSGAVAGSDTARGTGTGSTELELKNGFLVNKNSITLRWGTSSGNTTVVAADQALFVGSFRTTADGTTEDSLTKRFLSNAYNATWRKLRRSDSSTTPLTYSTAAWQQYLGNAANQVEVLQCVTGRHLNLIAKANGLNSTTTPQLFIVSIGRNSTNTPLSNILTIRGVATSALMQSVPHCFLDEHPPLGYNKYVWLHFGAGADTQSWFTDTENGLSGGVEN